MTSPCLGVHWSVESVEHRSAGAVETQMMTSVRYGPHAAVGQIEVGGHLHRTRPRVRGQSVSVCAGGTEGPAQLLLQGSIPPL